MISRRAYLTLVLTILPVITTATDRVTQLTQVEKAKLELAHAKAEYDSARAARDAGILSDLSFAAEETAYRRAELDYEEAALRLTGAQQQVAIESVVKSRVGGSTFATVTLSYHVGDDMTKKALVMEALERCSNVSVSLLSDAGVVVSMPYEARLSELRDGQAKRIRFVLLKDVDTVQVVVKYNGQEERSTVYLLRDSAGPQIALTATQPSEDVEIGGSAVFNIRVERLSVDKTRFRLKVDGLPPEVAAEFLADGGTSRISEIAFSDQVATTAIQLKVYLPKNVPASWIDRPIRFSVDCVAAGTSGISRASGVTQLELVPRGTGGVRMAIANLFREVKVGNSVAVRATLTNSGTLPLYGVGVGTEVPADWKVRMQPGSIQVLRQNEQAFVDLTLTPPPDAFVGEYEARLRPLSTSGGRKIEADDQILRIHLLPRAQNVTTVVLLFVVLGLLAVVGYLAIRLSRT